MSNTVRDIVDQKGKNPLVWVIDDCLLQQEVLAARLEFAGYRTEGSSSHRLAADKIGGPFEMPQVIFCDYETESHYSADWFMEQLKASDWLNRTKVFGISGSEDLNLKLESLGSNGSINNGDFKQIVFGDTMSVAAQKLKQYLDKQMSWHR
jgi:CheY-like chemotaxis protein